MDNDDVFTGTLTTQKILTAAGQTDLADIEELVLKLDTRVEIGIANIGTFPV